MHLPIFYSPSYVAAGHAFETTRKAAWVASSLQSAPLSGVTLQVPRLLGIHDLRRVHEPRYVESVRTGEPRELAESQGFSWDPALWEAVCASSGGMVEAALSALSRKSNAGTLSSGLHHARAERGDGSCTFNGLALATKAALAAGASAVLILDLDAHFGGGTRELLREDPRVVHVDVSVDSYDVYPEEARWRVSFVDRATEYLGVIAEQLLQLRENAFDLCIYNAGMDPHEHCPEGGLRGVTTALLRAREALVFGWCHQQQIPVAFALAGGYLGPRLDQDLLVALHRETVEAARPRGD